MLRIADSVADCVWLAIPQATEWQHVGNQIDAPTISAGADLVNVRQDYLIATAAH
jgi:hypothetical protein